MEVKRVQEEKKLEVKKVIEEKKIKIVAVKNNSAISK